MPLLQADSSTLLPPDTNNTHPLTRRRQARVRAGAYRAARLLGGALTEWTALWSGAAQRRAYAEQAAGAQRRQLAAAVAAAWAAEARRQAVKRKHAEM